MAIEEEVIDEGGQETAEEREERLQREQDERTAALRTEQEARHKAELEAATAKGELEALKRGLPAANAPSPAWTDEQWESEAQKHGMTGAQLKATVGISNTVSDAKTAAAMAAAESARKEAAEARAEARQARAGASAAKVEEEFYRANPALAARKADVDEFLGMLPEEAKADPKKFKESLEKAKTFVRGKAREDLSTRRAAPGGQRAAAQTHTDDEGGEAVNDDVDVSDLDNEGAQALVRRIAKNPGGDGLRSNGQKSLSEIDNPDELLKRTARSDGRGVSIDESDDWARAGRGTHKDVREGGKRPLKG